MEPEKKDVWEEEFDKTVAIGMPQGVQAEVKSFIKTHFIPRAEVVEWVKNLEVMGIGGAFGEGYEAGFKEAKTDLLDLLTQEK
jgi:hypothetical protein